MDFLVGGLAGVGAGFFSNPFDVIKTRMQLQGELQARGQHEGFYRNIPHAMYNIVKHDGIFALQKGLVPALWFQFTVNSVTLGLYQEIDNHRLLRDVNGQTLFKNSLFFAAIAGVIGGFVASPMHQIKVQLMSAASEKIAVGTQHDHSGFLYALGKIFKENGFTGLWRGANGMMLRNASSSATQIAAFAEVKEWIVDHEAFQHSKYLAAFMASHVSALMRVITTTPIDVITTRLYNQETDATGRGMLYRGIVDCARKIAQTEGPLGFYKGVGPAFIRQTPHSVILLVFWDMLKDFQETITEEAPCD